MAWNPVPITAKDSFGLRKEYNTFWAKVCNLNRGHADPAAEMVFHDELAGNVMAPGREYARIYTPRALGFKGVKSRRSRRSAETYDLYLESEQFIRAVENEDQQRRFEIVKCGVRLLYIESRSKAHIRKEVEGAAPPSRCLRGLHFDTSDAPFHPLMHVQIDHACINDLVLGRPYQPPVDERRLDVPRVPTAPLDVAGIVAMVMQDHLLEDTTSRDERREALTQLRDAARNLPRLCVEAMPYAADGDDPVPCAAWYPH